MGRGNPIGQNDYEQAAHLPTGAALFAKAGKSAHFTHEHPDLGET
jgi:hypothetical protein